MGTLESDLAHGFAPTYHASGNEQNYLAQLEPKRVPRLLLVHPPWKPYIYFSVVELGASSGKRACEINYLAVWDWDGGSEGGYGAHQWDTERVAVLVSGPADSDRAEAYRMHQAYYGAHEEVRFGGLVSLDNSQYVVFRRASKRGPDVWWSKGKHSSFPSLEALRASTAGDSFDTPGEVAKPTEYALVDAGTLEQPSREAPWIAYEQSWGPHRVTPVYSRLKDRLWDASGNASRAVRRATEDGIRQIQLELGVPQTGQMDLATLRRATATLPPGMLWTAEEAE